MSFHDGPSNRSTVLREDTDFIDSYINNVDSTGNQMFIRYHSAIEQPRVYGFLLRFYCMSTTSEMLKKEMSLTIDYSDQDCFLEDNTIEFRSKKKFKSGRIPVSRDKIRRGKNLFNNKFMKPNVFHHPISRYMFILLTLLFLKIPFTLAFN